MSRMPTTLLAAAIALGFSTARASDQVADNYACVMEGTPELPYPTAAGGACHFSLSAANELSYGGLYQCAIGSDAILAVHIHGPGPNGPILFSIPVPPPNQAFSSGVLGVLDSQQLHDLNCGLWYLDFHSTYYPFAQLRGQIRGLWGWQPASPCFLATEPSTWGAVKSLYRQ